MSAALIILGVGFGLMISGVWLLVASRPPPARTEDQLADWAAGLDRGLAEVDTLRWRRSPAPWAVR